MKIQQLSPKMKENLGFYVYLYIDPRNQEIFYIGKGCGSRCHAHLSDPREGRKTLRIREIQAAGLEPQIEILVHGLVDEFTALKIEAAVIDLLGKKSLTNLVRGYGSGVFGRTSLAELAAIYEQEPAVITEPVLLIRVNKLYRYGISPEELYDITRGVWRLGDRRGKAKYALCIYAGIVREVYCIEGWFPAGTTPGLRSSDGVNRSGRWEFTGRVADEDVRQKYLLKSVEAYLTKGSQNPITYVNCL